MIKEDVLSVRAKFNGKEFSFKLYGEDAVKMTDLLIAAIKGESEKEPITQFK